MFRHILSAYLALAAHPAAAECLHGAPEDYYAAWGREGLYDLLIPNVLEYYQKDGQVPWDCLVREYEALGSRFWVDVRKSTNGVKTVYWFNKKMLNPIFYFDFSKSPEQVGVESASFGVSEDGVSVVRANGRLESLKSE